MRAPRSLREKAKQKTPAPTPAAATLPEGYRHSQTDGFSSAERAATRRFDHGERDQWHDMPVIMGFTRNPD